VTALLDTQQIASLLNVTREYVTDKLTKRPGFPAPRINQSRRLRRWAESDVLAYLAGQGKRAAMSEADSR
jgi:predicted DNA-binding transcriptional regulator AlpA